MKQLSAAQIRALDKYLYIPEDFTVDNGMLSRTMNLKKAIVLQEYGDMLQMRVHDHIFRERG